MPQSKLQVDKIKDNADLADKLKKEGEALSGMKWVNAHSDTGVVVITFDEGFDESQFQSVVDSL